MYMYEQEVLDQRGIGERSVRSGFEFEVLLEFLTWKIITVSHDCIMFVIVEASKKLEQEKFL